MIYTVLNRDGVAVMGLEGNFVHFGQNFRSIERPYSDGLLTKWCAEVSTAETQLKWIDGYFVLTRLKRDFYFSYTQMGLYMLRELLSMDQSYCSRLFESMADSEIVSTTPICEFA